MIKRQIFLLSILLYQCLAYNENSQNFQVKYEDLFDYDLYDRVIDDEACSRHMAQMNQMLFFDASFRIPQGIITGNSISYGNYFQCLDIKQQIPDDVIEGKHCVINFKNQDDIFNFPFFSNENALTEAEKQYLRNIRTNQKDSVRNMKTGMDAERSEIALAPLIFSTFRLGVCIPKSCSVEQALQPLFNNTLLQIDFNLEYCRLPGDKIISVADYVCMAVFGVIGLVTILSTTYELWQLFGRKADPSTLNWFYKSCSVYGNTQALCSFGTSKPGSLDCLDGIRTLSILWIIIGHSVFIFVGSNTINLFEAILYRVELRSLWIGGAEYAVDTFFMLSGLLLVYTSCKKMKQGQLLKNIHLFYLHRILRLFPLLGLTVLVHTSVLHHVADGPAWRDVADSVDVCKQYWWATLLYIQNYYNYPDYCLGHSWYLAVDMQLFILSPLLLFWLLGSKRVAWAAATVVLAGSMIASTVFIFLVLPDAYDGAAYYVNTLTRAPAFIIGMVVGYLLHCCQKKKVNVPLWIVLFLWICSLATFGLVMYSVYAESTGTTLSIVYALKRPGWCVALAWLIFACVHGYSGPINWLLSLTMWKFMSRISYAMYLLHFPIQFIASGAQPTPLYFKQIFIFSHFIQDLAFTVMASIISCVLVDMPFATILRKLLSKSPKPVAEEAEKPTTTEVVVDQEEAVHTKKHVS